MSNSCQLSHGYVQYLFRTRKLQLARTVIEAKQQVLPANNDILLLFPYIKSTCVRTLTCDNMLAAVLIIFIRHLEGVITH